MIFLASTPAPSTDGGVPDPDLVTPGTIGFLATLAVVILTIFLIRDALRRVRRVRARSGDSDAYPIPLRKYVVPNQSKLSGPEAPQSAEDSTDAAETSEAPEGTEGAEDSEEREGAEGSEGSDKQS